ncbi:hypothetical protein SE_p518 (plasmid) [Staphylococcus epidermidis ATCC 12228]|uniref:Uncharacterized protein n=1 Tax=Staphylococcus epidermidis (strain ATCC 12228 / FDA PCI 1200) TaxID=176280 RepID=A0A0H2VL64_STAES|nr:hypothetical protein SE_p518 [Staphylococcus epidermidis ATCC 12228]
MAQLNTVPTAVVKILKPSVIMKTHHHTIKTHHKQQHNTLKHHNMIQQIKHYQRQVNLILV